MKVDMCGKEGMIRIVDGVNININRGETVGLVGETGAGKTVTALSVLGILQPVGKGKPLWRIEGRVLFEGKDLFELLPDELRVLRGTEIAFIPQNPIPSLHPMNIVGGQTGETLTEYDEARLKEVRELVVQHLGKVEISDAKKRYDDFRDQFSGGEGQRILIAMALIRNPSLLIADEPTSSLDVTVQRQILQLLKAMKKKFNLSMLLITHDLGVIAEMSDFVYVMYAGKIVEHADVKTIFKRNVHPYTTGLLASIPRIDLEKGLFEFGGLSGDPPNPLYPIPGCKFHPRCKYAKSFCADTVPPLKEIEPNHYVACLRTDEIRNL
ncbi:MAG: ABC transporter ATP-binding protein [Candidatus Bathyarchaeota archaeon]|nr:ABC transporter ATP-binding protein [Candidatus Bathyarchaeota archaeon]